MNPYRIPLQDVTKSILPTTVFQFLLHQHISNISVLLFESLLAFDNFLCVFPETTEVWFKKSNNRDAVKKRGYVHWRGAVQ